MINVYVVEKLAIADHAQRLRQAEVDRQVRLAYTTQRPVTWWAALLLLWRALQEYVAPIQSNVYESDPERR